MKNTFKKFPKVYDQRLKLIIAIERGINADQILSDDQTRPIVYARHLYLYILVVELKFKPYHVESIIECNHSNVNHAIKNISNLIDTDKQFNDSFQRILVKVREMHDEIKSQLPLQKTTDLKSRSIFRMQMRRLTPSKRVFVSNHN